MHDPIRQEIELDATPAQVYTALTSGEGFAAFSGQPATIDAVEGGRFACFNGQITGRNIELVPDTRVVQAWRVGAWDEGVYSIVRFELGRQGERTRVVLEQSGFPAAHREHLDGGWDKMYWEPLRGFLA